MPPTSEEQRLLLVEEGATSAPSISQVSDGDASEVFFSVGGASIHCPLGDWHYVFEFKRCRQEDADVNLPADPTDGYPPKLPCASAVVRELFGKEVIDEWEEKEGRFWSTLSSTGIKKCAMHDVVWKKMADLFQGPRYGFSVGWHMSANEKEVFLVVRLTNAKAISAHAENMKVRLPISAGAHAFIGTEYLENMGLLDAEADPSPAYMEFSQSRADEFTKKRDFVVAEIRALVGKFLANGEGDQLRKKAKENRGMKNVVIAFMKDALVQQGEVCNEKGSITASAEVAEDIGSDDTAPEASESGSRSGSSFGPRAGPDSETRGVKKGSDGSSKAEMQNKGQDADDGKNPDTKKRDNLLKLLAELTEDHGVLKHERGKVDKILDTLPEFSPSTFEDMKLYEDLQGSDVLKVVHFALAKHVNLAAMVRHGFLKSSFPLHQRSDLQVLSKEWASLGVSRWFRCLPVSHRREIRQYFGDQVALYFSWLRTSILHLGVMSLLLLTMHTMSHFQVEATDVDQRKLAGGLLIVWLVSFTPLWHRWSTSKMFQRRTVPLASAYEASSDHTCSFRSKTTASRVRYISTWVLVAAFIAYAICSTMYILRPSVSDFRQRDGKFERDHIHHALHRGQRHAHHNAPKQHHKHGKFHKDSAHHAHRVHHVQHQHETLAHNKKKPHHKKKHHLHTHRRLRSETNDVDGLGLLLKFRSLVETYLLGINVAIMSIAWSKISSAIFQITPWKARPDDNAVTQAQVNTVVFCIIFYAPFIIYPWVRNFLAYESRRGDEELLYKNLMFVAIDEEELQELLYKNLMFVAIFHMANACFSIAYSIASRACSDNRGTGMKWTDVEEQANRAPPDDIFPVILQSMVRLGGIVIFAPFAPMLIVTELVTQILIFRHSAWKVCWFCKRAVPVNCYTSETLVWCMRSITLVAVFCSGLFARSIGSPTILDGLGLPVVFVLIVMAWLCWPTVSSRTSRYTELQEEIESTLLNTIQSPVETPAGSMSNLTPDKKFLTPGNVLK